MIRTGYTFSAVFRIIHNELTRYEENLSELNTTHD